MTTTPRPSGSALRLAALAGVTTTALSLLFQRPGVVLSTDGWAYWEGSISLLDGRGLSYFGGQPIAGWPPLFPAYLAAVQALAGRSAGALALAHALALGIAAALFACCPRGMRRSEGLGTLDVAFAGAIALVLALGNRAVLSESLFLACLGAACLAAAAVVLAFEVESSSRTLGARIALLLTALAGLVLTRHFGLAFLPAFAAFLAFRRPRGRRVATAAGAIVLATPVVIWLARVLWVENWGPPRVPFDLATPARVGTTALASGRALVEILVPRSLLAFAIFGAGFVVAWTLFSRAGSRSGSDAPVPDAHQPVGWFRVWVLALPGSIVVAALFGVAGARVVLPSAVLGLLALADVAGAGDRGEARRRSRAAAAALLVALAAVQLARGGYWVQETGSSSLEGLPWEVRLVSTCTPRGESCELPRGEIVPPDFPWIDRNWSAKHPDGGPSDGRP